MKDEKRTPRKSRPGEEANKANHVRPSPTSAPRKNGQFAPDSADVPPDDENRIDWERKQKHKRSKDEDDLEETETGLIETDLVETNVSHTNGGKKNKKDARKKSRQLVYDEDSGRVVMKRKRKRSNRSIDLHMIDLDDDWDEFDPD